MAKQKTDKPVEVKKEVKEVKSKKPALTVAVVMNGKYEVRRYSLEGHGENFEKLAQEFADKRKYTVELQEAKVGIKCPNCGHLVVTE